MFKKSITKPQIIQVISDRLDVSRGLTARFLEVLADVAGEALTRDKDFLLPDVVHFILKDLPAKPFRPGKGFVATFKATPARVKIVAKPCGQTRLLEGKLNSTCELPKE